MRTKFFKLILICLTGFGIAAPGRLQPALHVRDTCPVPVEMAVTAPKPNPFKSLTIEESNSVARWLLDNAALGLNLTNHSDQTKLRLSDNYIAHIEALKPNKTDVLSYLYGDGTVPRYARVVLNHGARPEPVVTEYSVGPLPIDADTKLEPLDWMYNGPNGASVGINAGYADTVRHRSTDRVVAATMSSIADITQDLIGLVYYGLGDKRNTAAYYQQNPYSTDGSTGIFWTPWRRAGLAPFSRPSDLYVSFDVSGTDETKHHCRMIVYNLKVYGSVREFRAAWEAGEIDKTPPPEDNDEFLTKDRRGPMRDLEDRLAPTVLAIDGPRYKIDRSAGYLEYLGWSFYTYFDRDVGIQFYDIRFRNESIMYELSLQDAIAQYAGNNPFQAGTAYMDRFFGIGLAAGKLIPGYDCPYHATYLNTTYSNGANVYHQAANVCVFETDIGVPITRHSDPKYKHSTKGSKLVVRMIATVNNYDYLWDYAFYVDGTISVDAHASGYVQADYFRPRDQGLWGPRISQTSSGALHSHVMNFKADFDLINTKNTLTKTDIIVENITQPWFPERGEFEMMRYNISDIANEDEGLLDGPVNGQTMYTIVNKDHKNRWGVERGYRILPGLANVVLASKRSPFLLRSAEFGKQPFAVSRQHDSEPGSSAALNQNVPEAPLVQFYDFFDGEDLVQQDIVAWVNLGMQHYTRAEDVPNTLMSEAHSSIMFVPQNWGDAELTRDLANAIIYNDNGREGDVVPETNQVEPPLCLALGPEDELSGVYEVGRVAQELPHVEIRD